MQLKDDFVRPSSQRHTQSGPIAFLATKVIAKIVTDRRENSENNTRQKRAFIVIRLPAHYLLCSTSATLWVRFCGKYTLNQGSQTHLSMWAPVEDNSQSAGRTYATLFSLQLKAKIQYMYRQFTHV